MGFRSEDIMKAVTRRGQPFCRRRWLCVPNVSWGWGLSYEADLICIGKNGKCVEIEIKVSRHDIRQDAAKSKWRNGLDDRISRFYYAVPLDLMAPALDSIPEYCGLLTVAPRVGTHMAVATITRPAKTIAGARNPTPAEIQNLGRLGVMRYWDLMLKEGDMD